MSFCFITLSKSALQIRSPELYILILTKCFVTILPSDILCLSVSSFDSIHHIIHHFPVLLIHLTRTDLCGARDKLREVTNADSV